MKKMRDRYANLELCPRKRSPWDIVRSIVMLGQGLKDFLKLCIFLFSQIQASSVCLVIYQKVNLKNTYSLYFTDFNVTRVSVNAIMFVSLPIKAI